MKRAPGAEDGARPTRRGMTPWVAGVVCALLLVLAGSAWRLWPRPQVVMGAGSFRLQPGWAIAERRSGSPTVVLQNRLREVLHGEPADEIVLYESASPFDAVEMAQQWERLEVRRMIPGERLEPTPSDGFLRQNFRCSDIKRSDDGRIKVACFDRAGRWAVSLNGRRAGVQDVSRMLQELTSVQGSR